MVDQLEQLPNRRRLYERLRNLHEELCWLESSEIHLPSDVHAAVDNLRRFIGFAGSDDNQGTPPSRRAMADEALAQARTYIANGSPEVAEQWVSVANQLVRENL